MKKKILFFLCALLLCLLWILEYSHNRKQVTGVKTPKANDAPRKAQISESLPSISNQSEARRQQQINMSLGLKDIIQQGYKGRVMEAKLAMEAFLKTWNPVGHSTDELKSIFGNPSRERPGLMRYYFDTGFNGWAFDFIIQDGRVVSVNSYGA